MKKQITSIFLFLLGIFCFLFSNDWNLIEPGNPPSERHGHSMIELPDGRILLFGGEGLGDLKNDLFVYDLETGWSEIISANDPPPPRKDHVSWNYHNKMFLFGGKGANGALDDLWTIDYDNTLEWYNLTHHEKPSARYGCTVSTTSDGHSLILGGKDENDNPLKEFWDYSPGNLTRLPDCPKAFSDHIANLVNNDDNEYLFVFGETGKVAVYSFTHNIWELKPNGPPFYKSAHSVVGNNSIGQTVIFIFGGIDESGNENNVVYEFNTITGELVQRQEPLLHPIVNGAACPLPVKKPEPGKSQKSILDSQQTVLDYNSKLFVFGGLSGGIPVNRFYLFTPFSPPDSLKVIAPFDTVKTDSAKLIWNKALPIKATHYHVQISYNQIMNDLLVDTVLTDTFYTIRSLGTGLNYWWSIRAFNSGGWGIFNNPLKFFTYFEPLSVENQSLMKISLTQNYPNPFNPKTSIQFTLTEDGFINFTVYNLLGEMVGVLINSQYSRGVHKIDFDASNLTTGIYIYRLRTIDNSLSMKMMLIR